MNAFWGERQNGDFLDGYGAEPDENDFTDIVILSKGRALQYTVPSFPVCKAVLWEVKLQWKDHAEDVTHVFDGFFLENVKS